MAIAPFRHREIKTGVASSPHLRVACRVVVVVGISRGHRDGVEKHDLPRSSLRLLPGRHDVRRRRRRHNSVLDPSRSARRLDRRRHRRSSSVSDSGATARAPVVSQYGGDAAAASLWPETGAVVGEKKKKKKKKEEKGVGKIGRKIFLDCGANVASSVDLFLDTYPNAEDYEIFSFEIDPSLRPYFAGLPSRHRLFCPIAVVGDDDDDARNFTAYLQSSWTPKDKLKNGKEMHWGGGTLFPHSAEKSSSDGGQRQLAVRIDVPSIHLPEWILRSFTKDDHVILKLDIEGSEYGVLRSMLSSGAIELVDKLYGEVHEWAPNGVSKAEWRRLKSLMARRKVRMLSWEAESLHYADMESLNDPLKRTPSAGGQPGELLSTCRRGPTDRKSIGLSVAVGMNPLPAKKLIAILESSFHLHRRRTLQGAAAAKMPASSSSSSAFASSSTAARVTDSAPRSSPSVDSLENDDDDDDDSRFGRRRRFPVTIFVYSDFLKLYPDVVKRWAEAFDVELRGQRPRPPHPRTPASTYRKSLVSATRTFRRHDFQPNLLLSDAWQVSFALLSQARSRGLSVVRPTVAFPPFYGDSLSELEELYYNVRSVERTPKALRFINDALKADGGILTLDGDHDDSRLVSVFLLDFIRDSPNFDLVPLNRCF